jgi:genome maintenance exonuclease 1
MFIHEPIDLGYKDLVCVTPKVGSRTYESASDSNVKYPSITSVLSLQSKSAIDAWRKRVGVEEANRVSKFASSRGTRVHQIAEDYVNNVPISKMNLVPTMLSNFLPIKKVLDERLGVVYGQELALYSDYLKVAGRVDLVAFFDGVLSIIDYKTSGKLKKKEWITNYFTQESFYAIAFEERTKIPITQLVTIIAVDGEDDAQIFIEHRDNHDKNLLRCIKEYNNNNAITNNNNNF